MNEERKQRMLRRVERMGAEMGTIRSGRGNERMERLLDIEIPEHVDVEPGEAREYTGTTQVPTVFRYDAGEEQDWDVIIQSTLQTGKRLGDMDVPEKPTTVQHALANIYKVWGEDNGRKHRKYVLGWGEVDSDDRQDLWKAGHIHFNWMKIPHPGNLPRAQYAEDWARQHCKPGGVAGMVRCLMQWWTQGVTHVRIQHQARLWVNPEGDVVTVWAPELITHVFAYDNHSECAANMRLVQAAYRAMRSASSEQYVPENGAQSEMSLDEAEDVSI